MPSGRLVAEAYKDQDKSEDSLETLMYPGFRKIAVKYWRDGLDGYRSWSKAAFTRGLQRLVPDLKEEDLSTNWFQAFVLKHVIAMEI